MTYVAGIDGGQSGTDAAIADARGRVLGTGSAGPADEIAQGPESTRLHDALATALDAARRDAGLPPETAFGAIVAGVSGYEGRIYGRPPRLPTQRLSIVHDPAVAHAGALAGASGVVVIAGTGSIAYVVDDDGKRGIRGGLGYVFGDEGSAFWIAKTALAAAVEAHDGCTVAREALAAFGRASIREIFADFYHGALDRERFAAFAQSVLSIAARQTADDFDACAYDAVIAAQEHLAGLAAWAAAGPWSWRSRARASFVGGLMADGAFKEGVHRAARARAPRLDVVEPAYPPVLGAVLLALRETGVSVERLT